MVVEDLKDLEISISVHPFQIFEDFFSDDVFGGRRSRRRSSNRGNDLRYDVTVGLEDIYAGINKKINYTTYKKCSRC